MTVYCFFFFFFKAGCLSLFSVHPRKSFEVLRAQVLILPNLWNLFTLVDNGIRIYILFWTTDGIHKSPLGSFSNRHFLSWHQQLADANILLPPFKLNSVFCAATWNHFKQKKREAMWDAVQDTHLMKTLEDGLNVDERNHLLCWGFLPNKYRT